MAKKIRRVKTWSRSRREEMFIASILLGRITAGAAQQPAQERQKRAHEIVSSFRTGDLARLHARIGRG
jgi:hypothetical protein